MNLIQFFNILWARRFFALSIAVVTIVAALLVSLSLPKQYVATTSLVADQRNIDPVSGLSLPVQMLSEFLATQADIIASHNVARKVVERLNLSEHPLFKENKEGSEPPKISGDINDSIAEDLLSKLEVSPSRESSLISIDFASTDPELAAEVANAFAAAYIQTNIDLRTQPAKLSAEWFNAQMSTLRERLARAQAALSNYQQQHEIVTVDDRLDLENSRLIELSKQLVESQSHTSELQSRKDLLTSTLKEGLPSEAMQEVLSNSFIQSLKSDLSKAEAKFAELTKRVDINHPLYKQAKAEVVNLQQKIQLEIKMVIGNIANGVISSNQRDRILTNALAQQKAKVLELKKQHDEMAVLSHEVENAQRAYDNSMQREVQSRMESEMNQSNIAVLNPALPPASPTKPKVLINVLLSIFVGGMLGIGAALLAELLDRRVRAAQDISEILAVPVLAVIPVSTSKPIARLTRR